MNKINPINPYFICQTTCRQKQRGVVLVVSLVFLVALTSIAAVLMQNATTDMKMSGATEEKSVAQQELFSAVDEVIYNQVFRVGGINNFAHSETFFDLQPDRTIALPVSFDNTVASVRLSDGFAIPKGCDRMLNASSANIFNCSSFEVNAIKTYGRNNNNEIEVNAGIVRKVPVSN